MPGLVAYLGAAVALILAPGPDTAFVLAQAVGAGRVAGVRAALGVATGVCIHTIAAVAGLAALFRAAPTAYDAVALAGAAYLAYLGVRMLRGDGEFETELRADVPSSEDSGGFRRGLLTNVLNPKVALFFIAFLPQFGTGLDLLPLGGLYAALTAGYLAAVAIAAGRARTFLADVGAGRWLGRIAGGVTLALAGLAAREAV